MMRKRRGPNLLVTAALALGACHRAPSTSAVFTKSTDDAGPEHTESQEIKKSSVPSVTPDNKQVRPAGSEVGITGICDEDTRQKVTPASGPEKATCRLLIQFSSPTDFYQGTGFLVSPRLVLTAGHCVYDKSHGGWARVITIYPGDQSLGAYQGVKLYTVSGWVNGPSDAYDYGAIVLADDTMHKKVNFSFELRPMSDKDLGGTEFASRGYPIDKGFAQWISLPPANPSSTTPLTMSYIFDTERGQSGGPVFPNGSDGAAVAVHAKDGCPNSGTRINQARKDKILNEWSPH